jgi:hypothetical protein
MEAGSCIKGILAQTVTSPGVLHPRPAQALPFVLPGICGSALLFSTRMPVSFFLFSLGGFVFANFKKPHRAHTKNPVMRHLSEKDSRPAVTTNN